MQRLFYQLPELRPDGQTVLSLTPNGVPSGWRPLSRPRHRTPAPRLTLEPPPTTGPPRLGTLPRRWTPFRPPNHPLQARVESPILKNSRQGVSLYALHLRYNFMGLRPVLVLHGGALVGVNYFFR
jgi:hypothetical protein